MCVECCQQELERMSIVRDYNCPYDSKPFKVEEVVKSLSSLYKFMNMPFSMKKLKKTKVVNTVMC